MEMKMSRECFVEKLQEKNGRTEEECGIIKDILDSHGVIGRKNKEKIIADFIERINLNEKDADKLYNDCMEIIMKNIL